MISHLSKNKASRKSSENTVAELLQKAIFADSFGRKMFFKSYVLRESLETSNVMQLCLKSISIDPFLLKKQNPSVL